MNCSIEFLKRNWTLLFCEIIYFQLFLSWPRQSECWITNKLFLRNVNWTLIDNFAKSSFYCTQINWILNLFNKIIIIIHENKSPEGVFFNIWKQIWYLIPHNQFYRNCHKITISYLFSIKKSAIYIKLYTQFTIFFGQRNISFCLLIWQLICFCVKYNFISWNKNYWLIGVIKWCKYRSTGFTGCVASYFNRK